MYAKFKAALGLKNRHLQTIYPALFRKNNPINFEIEMFKLSDGDFLECYWNKVTKQTTNAPVVILFHGLAGSYKSPYIIGLMNELNSSGFNSVLMHFRGCGDKENLLPRSYHSGESADTLEYIISLKEKYPHSKLYAVGFSLGANMLLKLLGEGHKNLPVQKAIAISAPMQLDICANQMNKGFSKFYQKMLVNNLNEALDKKYDKHRMSEHITLKRENIKKLKTFWDFDGAYTAPVHGFKSAQDYYNKCSSKQFLKHIVTPTLIIHAKDDPFMTQKILPNKNDLSKYTKLEIYENGGHVGFISGTLFKPKYWLDKRVVTFFNS